MADPVRDQLTVIPGSPFEENEPLDPYAIAVHPSGKFLYVVNQVANDVSVFSVDPNTFALTELPNSPFAASGGTDPIAVVVDPSGKFLYLVNTSSNNADPGRPFGSLNSYLIDQSTGALAPTTMPSLDLMYPPLTPLAILADPAGENLYVIGSESGNLPLAALETFGIDPTTGNASQIDISSKREYIAYSGAISPNGKFLYWGIAQTEGEIDLINNAGSTPVFLSTATGAHPTSLAVDSTNSYLFASFASGAAPGLWEFSIDSAGDLVALPGSPFAALPDGTSVADPYGPFLYSYSGGAFQIAADGSLTALPGFSTPDGITGIGTFGPPSTPIQPISGPAATFQPLSLSFNAEPVGTSSAAQQIALTNSGSQNLLINPNGVSITGANSADFVIQSTSCLAVLIPSASCSFMIAYDPSVAGSEQATLVISDNVAGGSSTVPLSGSGFVPAPAVTLVPGSLSFHDTNEGSSSASMSISVINSGAAALNFPIGAVLLTGANPGDFSQTNTCDDSAIAVGGSCAISVTFQPTAVGSRTAQVRISDGAAGAPQTASLSGNGLKVPFLLGSTSSASQMVTAGATAFYSLQLTPVGGFTGMVSLSCTGAPQGAACMVQPTLQVSGAGAVPFSATVTTTASSTATIFRGPWTNPASRAWIRWSEWCGFFAGLSLLFALRRRREMLPSLRHSVLGGAALAILLIASGSLISCAVGPPASAPSLVPGTPSGSSTLTVTAAPAGGSVVQTLSLILTVQ